MLSASSNNPGVPELTGPEEPHLASRPPLHNWWIAPVALLLVTLIYFFMPAISGLLVSLYPVVVGWSHAQAASWLSNSIFAQFIYVLLAEALTVAAIFQSVKAFRWNLATIGLTRPKWYHPLAGIAAFVPYYVLLAVLVAALSRLFPGLNVDQAQQLGFGTPHGGMELALLFISLVVLPPLAEEITVRGFLYSGLRTWFPRIAAGLITSLAFGAAHLAEGGAAGPLWIGAIDTFTLSVVLVTLREQTGNLWAGITLHALKNGVAFTSLFLLHVH